MLTWIFLAALQLVPTYLASQECEQILQREGTFYLLGYFYICEPTKFELRDYVLAQAFRFAVGHSNVGRSITLGYKLVTFCEQPSGCTAKALEEIERNHTRGLQIIVTIFFSGAELPSSFKNIPQVNVNDQITIYGNLFKRNYEGALDSLMSLMKTFQWNLVGFIHSYRPELKDLIEEFVQADKREMCIDFKHSETFNGMPSVQKISTSKSNVTVVIDKFDNLWYMKKAMEKLELERFTGKQLIHCCIQTIFDLQGIVFNGFHGTLSMCKKSRPLPGFLEYLLDMSVQDLGNTTVKALFQKSCFSCSVKAGFVKPCKNLDTAVPVDTNAGSSASPKCPAGPTNICRSCLTSLAELDPNFMMYSFIKKLGLATEEMYRKQHPSLPRNGSHFNGDQFQEFIIANYSPLAPVNQEPFEACYWKVSEDEEIELLKVDIDLERATSESFNPPERTVRVQGGETITIPPSYCFRSCHPGEKAVLHRDLPQHCCYYCKPCKPGTYGNGTAFEKCWSCPQDEWSETGQEFCSKKNIVYLLWSDPISLILIALAVSGLMLTISVLALYVKHKGSPIVKAAGGPIFYCTMVSLLCSFVSVLLFFGAPTAWKCKIRMPAFGVSFAFCLASVLAKSIWGLCAFTSQVGKPTKLQTLLYQVILGAGPVLQCVICCGWLFFEPPGVQNFYPTNQTYLILKCFNETKTGFSFLFGYLCFLAFACLLTAIRGYSLPKYFSDSQGICFAMMTIFAVWLSVMPVLDSGCGTYIEPLFVMLILVSSFSCLVFLFAQRCYIILFRPNRNTTEWIKKSTYEYCQKVAENAELDLQFESSIATIHTST
ncbi:extracellular calcium-sensing receptor [Microcaecilia unicolor]|uniref:Extracellular calcium-sensing receptor-like n=1 Tax=Microcaecilia unicolor TaxID=1415580 RepID=A0A6P7Y7H3_9AMPH|nr:extracellular calcium-sensing receptor-like [Microcaecilia unicolor]